MEGVPFAAGPVVESPCCEPGPEWRDMSVVWASPAGEPLKLLALRTDTALLYPPLSDEFVSYRESPGVGTWTFESVGMTAYERARLADAVTFDDATGFVLADPTMELVAHGWRGVGRLSTQVYAGVGGRIRISVGDYRGQLEELARIGSVEARTFVGRTGYELVGHPNGLGEQDTTFVWHAGGGRWARVDIPHMYAGHVDELAAALVASDPPAPAALPVVAEGEVDGDSQLYVGDVLVSETPTHGPMIAFVLEGPLRAGGIVPLAGWDWDDVIDEWSAIEYTSGGPWRVIGTWDGTTFTVLSAPVPVPTVQPAPSVARTPGCADDAFMAERDQIAALDQTGVGPFTDNVLGWNGDCGLYISGCIDGPALRDRVAPFADLILEYRCDVRPIGFDG